MDKELKLKYVIIITIVSLILGFFIGEEYTTSKFTNISSKSSTTKSKSTSEQNEEIIKKTIGEEIELASVKATIKSFEEIKSIQPYWGEPVFPSQGAKFVKVNLTVINITDSEFNFSSNWASIVNQEGKKFTEHEDSYEADDYIGYETLKPDIPVSGSIIFEVSESSDELFFVMSKSGTSEKYEVELK